ncbi:MAG TPA: type II secretion system protein GspM [Candidatus Rifleibacterium sp.]|nr:type II secretion system protein GspM [Candidatus Rifleibacterium sp.]HPT44517.1 type II secretion system protein GspM [Candidatus Rifleibacterium sp.]
MEKVKQWWLARNPRDRRALLVLLAVVPAILFWYLVTRPLEDRLKLAHRVLETSRTQAGDLQKKLSDYAVLHARAAGQQVTASQTIVTALESAFRALPPEVASPTLNRTTLTILGKSQPAAQVSIDRVSPAHAWQILAAIASVGVNVAELDLSSDPAKNLLSASFKAW